MVSDERRQVVVADGVELSVIVRDTGSDASAFLLVHGLASNARLWDGVAEYLLDAGHPSAAVDLRGHGRSARPDDGYDFARVAQDLAQVVESMLGRPVIVAGQSWGGNVAVEFADHHPDLVLGLVCIDGGFLRLADDFEDWESAARQLAPPDFSGLTVDQLRQRARHRFADWSEAAIDAQIANFEVDANGRVSARLSRDRHMVILRHLWEHDPDETASRIGVPALVLAVDEEREGRSERVDAFARSMGDATVEWIDAHHDVHTQRPKQVAWLLTAFAERLGR